MVLGRLNDWHYSGELSVGVLLIHLFLGLKGDSLVTGVDQAQKYPEGCCL